MLHIKLNNIRIKKFYYDTYHINSILLYPLKYNDEL